MNDLPKVYANKINKDLKNYQEKAIVNNINIIDFKEILSEDKYLFNHRYLITLNDNKIINDSIIYLYNNRLLTLDNSWINIDDVKNIIEIKK